MNKVSITFAPSGKAVSVAQGTTILEAAREAGLHIQSVCGGDGVCGKCRVIIPEWVGTPLSLRKQGKVESPPTGLLTPEEIDDGVVLACEAKVFEDISVEIPPESRADEGEILMGAQGAHKKFDLYSNVEELEPDIIHEAKILQHSPLSTKIFLKLPPPTLDDIISDLERIYRALHKLGIDHIQTGLANLKNIGGFLRRHNWEVTVTLGKRNGTTEMVQLEGGDTSQTNYGVAVDIGTTTVVAHLVDLVSEQTICSTGAFNKQITYGDDIISRIIFASEKEGLEKLHLAVVDNINSLIQGCINDCPPERPASSGRAGCGKSKHIKLEDITCVLCAGNPTMTHLLLNIDPSYLRKEPYVPTTNEMPVIRAAEAGIKINPRGLMACAPGVSSYIGADITAGLLVSDLTERPEVAMYIDMGTNGEIVLGNKDWLTCCACSVGPAFEGSGIRCGTRAIKGAIQKVRINTDTKQATVETIGDATPLGICGSGLIEIISELLNAGIINKAGKISEPAHHSCPAPGVYTERSECVIPAKAGIQSGGNDKSCRDDLIRKGDEGLEYIVVPASQSATGRDIVLTQADIDHIIRSKAAVYAGIATLLKKMNYTVKDVSRFYIAGGFGSHLDIAKAIDIGLLPNAPLDRFSYIGNGSVEGARMILLSYIAMAKARQVADKMTYIELSTDNTFTEEFISAMFLPHTDLSLFSR